MYLWQLRRSVHPSWLVACLCFGICLGVILVPIVKIPWFSSISWLLLGIVVVVCGFWKRKAYFIPLIIIAGVMVGLWRGSVTQIQLRPYEDLIGRSMIIRGNLTEDVEVGKGQEIILRLGNIHTEGRSLGGVVWVTVPGDFKDLRRGDGVAIQGKVMEGFGSFSAAMYRAEVKNVEKGQDVALEVRDRFSHAVHEAVGRPEASLGVGFLTGQRRSLDPEVETALQTAGLMHIVVASGYNLTILVRAARKLFAKVSRYAALLGGGTLVLGFVSITGMSPSMSRAGLVAGLSLLVWYYGRNFHPVILLLFTAALTLLINPLYGWGDVGWQLSFGAFAGVMILAPLAQRYFYGDEKPGELRRVIGETLAAWIVTLPILAVTFGEVSNVAIVANIFVLPFLPLAMLLTFLAGIATLFFPSLSEIWGLAADLMIRYMIWIADYFSQFPWAKSEVSIGSGLMILMYALIVGFCVFAWRKTGYGLRDVNVVE